MILAAHVFLLAYCTNHSVFAHKTTLQNFKPFPEVCTLDLSNQHKLYSTNYTLSLGIYILDPDTLDMFQKSKLRPGRGGMSKRSLIGIPSPC